MKRKNKRSRRAKGEGAIVKRGAKFYFRNVVDGRPTETLIKNPDGSPCGNREQAEELMRGKKLGIVDQSIEAALVQKVQESAREQFQSRQTPEEIWHRYATSTEKNETCQKLEDGRHNIFLRFAAWLKDRKHKDLYQLSPDDANEFFYELGKRVSNRTFNDYLQTLSMIFNIVGESLGFTASPFAKIKKRPLETISRKEFTDAQVEKIFAGFREGFFYKTEIEVFGPDRQRLRKEKVQEYKPLYGNEMEVLMKICCYTGADGQSGCLMKWDNVDFAQNRIDYIRHKTKKRTNGLVITVPIHPTLREALERALAWREEGTPYILPHVARRYMDNRHGVQKDAQRIIRIALGVETTDHGNIEEKRALAPCRYSLHSFRHTFVSFCVNAGVPLAILAEIVGHGNPMMTKHYAHINTEAKTKAIAILPSFGLSSTPPVEQSEEARQKLLAYIKDAAPEQLAELSSKILPPNSLVLPA